MASVSEGSSDAGTEETADSFSLKTAGYHYPKHADSPACGQLASCAVQFIPSFQRMLEGSPLHWRRFRCKLEVAAVVFYFTPEYSSASFLCPMTHSGSLLQNLKGAAVTDPFTPIVATPTSFLWHHTPSTHPPTSAQLALTSFSFQTFAK